MATFHTAHYNIIAAKIHSEYARHRQTYNTEDTLDKLGARVAIQRLTYSLAQRFQEDNPNFDANKFIRATGVDVNHE